MHKQTQHFTAIFKIAIFACVFGLLPHRVEAVPYLFDVHQNFKIKRVPNSEAEKDSKEPPLEPKPEGIQQLQINYCAELPPDFGATAVTLVTTLFDNGELDYTFRFSLPASSRVLKQDSNVLVTSPQYKFEMRRVEKPYVEHRGADEPVWAIRLRLLDDNGKFIEGSCLPAYLFDNSEQSILKGSGRIFFDKGEFASAKTLKWQICLVKDFRHEEQEIVTCTGYNIGYVPSEPYPDDSQFHWIDLHECQSN